MDSGGELGSISKDSVDERLSIALGARVPSGAGMAPPSCARPVSTGYFASVPDSTVLWEEEASGG